VKIAEKIIKVWRTSILIFLGIAGNLVLFGILKNPFSLNEIAGIVVLMFAVIHTEYIGKALEALGRER